MYGLYTTLSRTIQLLKKETEQKKAEQAKGEAIQTELHVLTPSESEHSDKQPREQDESDNELSHREEESPEIKETPRQGQTSHPAEVVLRIENMTPDRAEIERRHSAMIPWRHGLIVLVTHAFMIIAILSEVAWELSQSQGSSSALKDS
jgi:hypothetical protein